MFFCKSKIKRSCYFCKGSIQEGDLCLVESFKNKDNSWGYLFYHESDCYEQYKFKFVKGLIQIARQKYNDKKAKIKVKIKGKTGRPSFYTDVLKAQNIRRNINYNKKQGNMVRVAELEAELESLRVIKPNVTEVKPDVSTISKEGGKNL